MRPLTFHRPATAVKPLEMGLSSLHLTLRSPRLLPSATCKARVTSTITLLRSLADPGQVSFLTCTMLTFLTPLPFFSFVSCFLASPCPGSLSPVAHSLAHSPSAYPIRPKLKTRCSQIPDPGRSSPGCISSALAPCHFPRLSSLRARHPALSWPCKPASQPASLLRPSSVMEARIYCPTCAVLEASPPTYWTGR